MILGELYYNTSDNKVLSAYLDVRFKDIINKYKKIIK